MKCGFNGQKNHNLRILTEPIQCCVSILFGCGCVRQTKGGLNHVYANICNASKNTGPSFNQHTSMRAQWGAPSTEVDAQTEKMQLSS